MNDPNNNKKRWNDSHENIKEHYKYPKFMHSIISRMEKFGRLAPMQDICSKKILKENDDLYDGNDSFIDDKDVESD